MPFANHPALSNLAALGINVSGRLLLLGQLLGADMNSTADQAISLTGSSKYVVTSVLFTNASISLTTAKGALYTGASKTGALFGMAVTAPYTYLTAANLSSLVGGGAISGGTNGGSSAVYTGPTTINLSLTTAQGAPATCDLYVLGYDLS